MLNSLHQPQKILVLGGKSDLALAILKKMDMSIDAELFLCGRNIATLDIPFDLANFKNSFFEMDFKNIDLAKKNVNQIFQNNDIDLAIIAYSTFVSDLEQLEPDNLENAIVTNFYTQAILLNQIYLRMVKQGHGQILLLSSVAGQIPRKFNFVYGATKVGIDFFAQGLQKYATEQNVFITILRPGFVFTKMTNGLISPPFSTDRDYVAKLAVGALLKKRRIQYVPSVLRYVLFILKILPLRIFQLFET